MKGGERADKFSHLFFPVGDQSNGKKGWWHLPRKATCDEDPEKWRPFRDNLKILMNFGSKVGWCVRGEDVGTRYLTEGDFYVYAEENDPKIAIRFGDQNRRILELRGVENVSSNVIPYWNIVRDFAEKMGFVDKLNAANSVEWRYVNEVFENNKKFKENPEEVKKFLSGLEGLNWEEFVNKIFTIDKSIYDLYPELKNNVSEIAIKILTNNPFAWRATIGRVLPDFLIKNENFGKAELVAIDSVIKYDRGYLSIILEKWDSLSDIARTEEEFVKLYTKAIEERYMSIYQTALLPRSAGQIIQKNPHLYEMAASKFADEFCSPGELLRSDISNIHSFVTSPRMIQKAYRKAIETCGSGERKESFGTNLIKINSSWRKALDNDPQLSKDIWERMSEFWNREKARALRGDAYYTTDRIHQALRNVFRSEIDKNSFPYRSGIAPKMFGEIVLAASGKIKNDQGELISCIPDVYYSKIFEYKINKQFWNELPGSNPDIAEEIKKQTISSIENRPDFLRSIINTAYFSNIPSWVFGDKTVYDVIYDYIEKGNALKFLSDVIFNIEAPDVSVSEILKDKRILRTLNGKLIEAVREPSNTFSLFSFCGSRQMARISNTPLEKTMVRLAPYIFALKLSASDAMEFEQILEIIRHFDQTLVDKVLGSPISLEAIMHSITSRWRRNPNSKIKFIRSYITRNISSNILDALIAYNPKFLSVIESGIKDVIHDDPYIIITSIDFIDPELHGDIHDAVAENFPEMLYEALINKKTGFSAYDKIYEITNSLSRLVRGNKEWKAYFEANKDKIYESYIMASIKVVSTSTDANVTSYLDEFADDLGLTPFSDFCKNNPKVSEYIIKNMIDMSSLKYDEYTSVQGIVSMISDIRTMIYYLPNVIKNSNNFGTKLSALFEDAITKKIQTANAYDVFIFVYSYMIDKRDDLVSNIFNNPAIRNILQNKVNKKEIEKSKQHFMNLSDTGLQYQKALAAASYLKSPSLFNLIYSFMNAERGASANDLLKWYKDNYLNRYSIMSLSKTITNDTLEFFPALKEEVIKKILSHPESSYGDLASIYHSKNTFMTAWPTIMNDPRIQTAFQEFENRERQQRNAEFNGVYNLFKFSKR